MKKYKKRGFALIPNKEFTPRVMREYLGAVSPSNDPVTDLCSDPKHLEAFNSMPSTKIAK
jgi:hypothetical protein